MELLSFPDDCYYVRHTPIARLWYKTEHLVWEDTDWCLKLEEDIRNNGLIAPLLIENSGKDRVQRPIPPFKVSCGHHRVQAMVRIGWTHVPCVMYGGPIPEEWERTEIRHHAQMKAYFPPHEEVKLWYGNIMILQTMIPENMEYPPNEDPYWPEDSEQT